MMERPGKSCLSRNIEEWYFSLSSAVALWWWDISILWSTIIMYIIMPITGTQKNKLMRNDLFHLRDERKTSALFQTLLVYLGHILRQDNFLLMYLLLNLLTVIQVTSRAIFFYQRSLESHILFIKRRNVIYFMHYSTVQCSFISSLFTIQSGALLFTHSEWTRPVKQSKYLI